MRGKERNLGKARPYWEGIDFYFGWDEKSLESFKEGVDLAAELRINCREQRQKAGRLDRSIYNNPGERWEVLGRWRWWGSGWILETDSIRWFGWRIYKTGKDSRFCSLNEQQGEAVVNWDGEDWRKSQFCRGKLPFPAVPVMVQWKRIWLGTMRFRVQFLASLNGLSIWHCRELWCKLQAWLISCLAVAVE